MIDENSSKEEVLRAIRYDPLCFYEASDKLKKDPEVALEAWKRDSSISFYINTHKKYYNKNREMILEGLAKGSWGIRDIGKNLQEDREIVLEAIRTTKNMSDFSYISDKLKKDSEFILEAVKLQPAVLRACPSSINNCKDIVLEAVKIAPVSLAYVGDDMKKDRDVVLQALESDPDHKLMVFAGKELKGDREFILKAVRLNAFIIDEFADVDFKKDEEVVLAAIEGIVSRMEDHEREELNGQEIETVIEENFWYELMSPKLIENPEFKKKIFDTINNYPEKEVEHKAEEVGKLNIRKGEMEGIISETNTAVIESGNKEKGKGHNVDDDNEEK